jgi:cation transporter-like permease
MINTMIEIHSVSGAIRDAVAPVFLLTGIGSILGVLIGRLGRSIDRARFLTDVPEEKRERFKDELKIIVRRTKWLRRAIGLATLAALCICVSIASMFVSVETGLRLPHLVMVSFIVSMASLILGLLCFLREIVLASREVIVPFQKLERFEKH